jgi:hypothetical protein
MNFDILIKVFVFIEHLSGLKPGLFFAQSRARIGAAVARGMELRAMGCSLMGVSKVFLLHIAPTRYGDQTLWAGELLAPGFSQWRLALAQHCCVNLYVFMYKVIYTCSL